MTTASNRKLALAAGGAIALAGAVLWARRSTEQQPPVPPASVSAPLPPTPSASTDSEPPPPPSHLPFEFDCQGFVATHAECKAGSPALNGLLDFANQYRVSGQSCAGWFSAANAKAASAALHAAEGLELRKLSGLEKAALQNAALKLLGCARLSPDSPEATSVAKQASAAVKRFTLSAEEQQALPQSAELLRPWLGDAAQWQRGVAQEFLHVRSEGFARAHLPMARAGTAADIVRLVLVDEASKPYFPDVVQRVALRRLEADTIHVCIAELVPSCPSELRPLPASRQPLSMRGPGSPPCVACHMNQRMPSGPFGPQTGWAPSDAAQAMISAQLPALLAK